MNFHSPLLENHAFLADFERLRDVSLNPARHTSANAHEHSLGVATRALALAAANGCTAAQTSVLRDLGLVHDIGKVEGTTSPAKSVELLPRYGLVDPPFVELVRYHDVNLPWHISLGRGEPPSDKAWRKMAARVDVYLLCLFMVADRVDCPGGWRENAPLVWFLGEAKRRGLLAVQLQLDVSTDNEDCAGVRFCLERRDKAVHATELRLSDFIDDRIDVHQHLHGIVQRLYLFGHQRSGTVAPRWLTHVVTWDDVRRAMVRAPLPEIATADPRGFRDQD